MLHLLNLEAQVSAHYGSTERDGRHNIHVDIRGNDLSVLIGRRSETLSAFQYIASLIVGKEEQQFVQLTVDVEGYRDRREKQLIQMAKRMADQVTKSGRPPDAGADALCRTTHHPHCLARAPGCQNRKHRRRTLPESDDPSQRMIELMKGRATNAGLSSLSYGFYHGIIHPCPILPYWSRWIIS